MRDAMAPWAAEAEAKENVPTVESEERSIQ